MIVDNRLSLTQLLRRVLDLSLLDCARVMRKYLRQLRQPRVGTRLTTNEARDLQVMRDDNQSAGPPFTASSHWQEVAAIFDILFKKEGIGNPEEQALNLRFSGVALGDPRLHRYVCWMYRCILKQRDKLGLLNALQATCKETRGFGYRFGSEFLSLDLLLSIDDFYNLYEMDSAVATGPVVIAELGAGWGRLGYVLQKVNPRATYILFDLPETLLISQKHLPHLLGESHVSRYVETRRIESFSRSLLEQRSLWFCGSQQLAHFDEGTIDFIINVGGLQEMPEDYVRSYFELFSKVAAGGHCYLKELCEGRFHGHRYDEIGGLAAYPFPKTWHQVYCRTSKLSDEFFEAGFRLSQPGSAV